MKPSDLWPVGWRRTGDQRYALIVCVLVFVLAPMGALALGAAVHLRVLKHMNHDS